MKNMNKYYYGKYNNMKITRMKKQIQSNNWQES